MELLVLLGLAWAWSGDLWEEVDPAEEVQETQVVELDENAVNITEITNTVTALEAMATVTATATTTSTSTSTSSV